MMAMQQSIQLSKSDRRYRHFMLACAIVYAAICLPHFMAVGDWYRTAGTVVVTGLFLMIRYHVWFMEAKRTELESILNEFKLHATSTTRVSDGAHIAMLELEKIINKMDPIAPLLEMYPHLTREEIERRLSILTDKHKKEFEEWKKDELKNPMP
jgi:hypothetical protein